MIESLVRFNSFVKSNSLLSEAHTTYACIFCCFLNHTNKAKLNTVTCSPIRGKKNIDISNLHFYLKKCICRSNSRVNNIKLMASSSKYVFIFSCRKLSRSSNNTGKWQQVCNKFQVWCFFSSLSSRNYHRKDFTDRDVTIWLYLKVSL